MSDAGSAGTLWVVATPLGNLEDLSSRAARALEEADVIFAEDTRHSKKLLSHLGITRPLRSLHEHNERQRRAMVLERLARGETICLVSDAGTPVISDPGADLIAAAREAGHRVSPIPGPSALAAALSVAGFPEASTNALFLGFLPRKGKGRRAVLSQIDTHTGVVVLYEAPGRIATTLHDLAELEPSRPACLCRELTKLYEETRSGTVTELATWAEAGLKGEITLVLGPTARAAPAVDDADVDTALTKCLDAGLSARDAATAVAIILGRPRREVYQRCQELKAAAAPEA